MRINKLALLAGLVITAVLFSEVVAHADVENESTKLTFSGPVEIPGRILPAGTYLFKLADTNERDLVQVFNSDGTRLYATLQTISADSREPSGNTVVIMAQQGPGRPEALLKWFYPGNTIGHEFIYPKQEQQQLTQYRQLTIVAKEAAEAGD